MQEFPLFVFHLCPVYLPLSCICFQLSCIFEFHSVLYVFVLFVSSCLSYMLVFNSVSCMFVFYSVSCVCPVVYSALVSYILNRTFMLLSHGTRKLRSITRNSERKGAAVSRGAAMIAMTPRLQIHIYSTSEAHSSRTPYIECIVLYYSDLEHFCGFYTIQNKLL